MWLPLPITQCAAWRGNAHGFAEWGGRYINLDYPGTGIQTFAEGINNEGQIVGWYNDRNSDHGFLYSQNKFTALNDPFATVNTVASGINDQGYIVGDFQDATPSGGLINHGFVYEHGILHHH